MGEQGFPRWDRERAFWVEGPRAMADRQTGQDGTRGGSWCGLGQGLRYMFSTCPAKHQAMEMDISKSLMCN